MKRWNDHELPRVLSRDEKKRDDDFDMVQLYKEIHENMRPPPDTSVYRDYRFHDHPFDYKVDAQYVSLFWKNENYKNDIKKNEIKKNDFQADRVDERKVKEKAGDKLRDKPREEELPAPKGSKIFAYV